MVTVRFHLVSAPTIGACPIRVNSETERTTYSVSLLIMLSHNR